MTLKLKAQHRRAIRAWLKHDRDKQKASCPFDNLIMDDLAQIFVLGGELEDECETVCPVLFPTLAGKRAKSFSRVCPCSFYSHKYVVRVARLVLARGGRITERRIYEPQKG